MRSALVLSPGIGTAVQVLLELGFKVYTNRITAEYVSIFKKNFPSVRPPPQGEKIDLLISLKDEVTSQMLERYKPTWLVSLPTLALVWKRRFHYSVFDLNCSYYNTPQSRKQVFFVGTREATNVPTYQILGAFLKNVKKLATKKPMISKEVLGGRPSYLLPPSNGRSLFSTDLPAPYITHKHWPIVIDFKPGPMDIHIDTRGAKSLSVEDFCGLQGIKYPLYDLSRKNAIKAISESVPPGVLEAVFLSIVKSSNK